MSTYKIHSRQTFKNAPPVYELTLHSGTKPADFKTRQGYSSGVGTVEVGTIKYPHDQLIFHMHDKPKQIKLLGSFPYGKT